MLTIDISAGHHINLACTNAAKLARHPLASQSVDGAWYAFTMLDDAASLVIGPWRKPDGTTEEDDGQAFWHHCREFDPRGYIVAHSEGSDPGVSFDFNGETVTCGAMPYDDPRTVADVAAILHGQWSAKMKASNDAYWTPERKAEEKRRQDEYAARMQARREAISMAMEKYPFQPTDSDAYAEYKRINADGYGGGVVRYGEAWAALMETALASGPLVITDAVVADAAERTQDEADSEGITGFMFGCAVQQLATWWKHGEALRVWHNVKHGVPAETSGVVNPAVLTIRA